MGGEYQFEPQMRGREYLPPDYEQEVEEPEKRLLPNMPVPEYIRGRLKIKIDKERFIKKYVQTKPKFNKNGEIKIKLLQEYESGRRLRDFIDETLGGSEEAYGDTETDNGFTKQSTKIEKLYNEIINKFVQDIEYKSDKNKQAIDILCDLFNKDPEIYQSITPYLGRGPEIVEKYNNCNNNLDNLIDKYLPQAQKDTEINEQDKDINVKDNKSNEKNTDNKIE